ncbi:extracellular solute-binding protein [Modestobacter roseus]|uniref:Putative spermidine/putrescine transport system substrate-binding protein n=1 Tax=Modestobacter roseus TaxID=1181884 RepID=A0A562IS51_9ACTN|nr:extracellular solute-binding protein [Modestobacter roseus]MQA35123.1 extracellular solute-binding protein [Modestobacter roseus]TWH73646.1 putative spermidine/putrescine transport system substrate-binding protein [Modestobacter roseus]
MLGTLGVIALATSLAACGSDDGSAAGSGGGSATGDAQLTFVGYGGDGQDAMIADWQEPYTAEHPEVTFVNTSPPDVAQVKAQVEAGAVAWDVVAVAPAAAQQNCGTLFEEIDYSGAPEAELVEQAVGDCYVGGFINSTPLAYRTEAFPDPSTAPKTVEDFFDTEEFPGQRGILTNLQNGILEYPLLADGVAPDELYPLDVDRALEKLDTIRDVTTFAPNVGALQQAVGSGQVDMFFLSDSRLVPLLDQGTDITVVWDTTVTTLSAFAVPKDAPNAAAAAAFVSSLTGPEASAAISEDLGTAPVNTTAQPELSENQQVVEVYGPVNTGETVMQDVDWYAENFNDVTAQLTNWLAG